MSQPLPPPPPGQSADHEHDVEPQALRADHLDHDTAYARAMYPELQPKRKEQVKLPGWTTTLMMFMVILFVLYFARYTFGVLGK
ncbi:MAG: hypothetical protein ACRELY_16785 [Polyangiaceae bacterium]